MISFNYRRVNKKEFYTGRKTENRIMVFFCMSSCLHAFYNALHFDYDNTKNSVERKYEI